MNIFLACPLHFVGVIGVQAVSYGTPETDSDVRRYTLISIGVVLSLPFVVGLIFTRIKLYRFRKAQNSKDLKGISELEASKVSTTSRKSTLPAQVVRLLDTKPNPILRLWWKRQTKLYLSGEADLEGNYPLSNEEDGNAPDSKPLMRQSQTGSKITKQGKSVSFASEKMPDGKEPAREKKAKKKKSKAVLESKSGSHTKES
jgi:hypothetical protein